MPWKELLQPTIDMCLNGFVISKTLAIAIKQYEAKVFADEGLRRVFIDPVTNKTFSENQTIKMSNLGLTLQKLSEDPDQFYNGTMAGQMVVEINQKGKLKKEDLIIKNK